MIWIQLLVGLFMLLAGRRLFWLFVACIGFASGYHCIQQVWAVHSPVLVLILSILAGAVGAIIAIFFQKAAIVVGGFAAGGYTAMTFFHQLGGVPAHIIWLPYIIGGIIGAIILFSVFDWALIFLSTFAGAGLIVQVLTFNPRVEITLLLVLIIAGMVFQSGTMPAETRKK